MAGRDEGIWGRQGEKGEKWGGRDGTEGRETEEDQLGPSLQACCATLCGTCTPFLAQAKHVGGLCKSRSSP